MLIGGVRADVGTEKGRDFRDPRISCILPISGQGTGQQGLTATSWSSLSIPMLTMTGSLDRGAGGQGPDWKREPFDLSPPGDKYFVFIQGANHLSFGGSRPGQITDVVKASTLAFWDAYLKEVPTARLSLKDGSVLEAWKAIARLTAK